MNICLIKSNTSFSSIIVHDTSNVMGVLGYENHSWRYILENAPFGNFGKHEEISAKLQLLDKFSKVWDEFSQSETKNIHLSTNTDVYDGDSIKSVVATFETSENGINKTLGTVKNKENFFDFIKDALNIVK